MAAATRPVKHDGMPLRRRDVMTACRRDVTRYNDRRHRPCRRVRFAYTFGKISGHGAAHKGASMGGYGSGNQRTRTNARPLTVERIRLDVGAFRRCGLPLDVVEANGRALSVTVRGGALYTWHAVEPGDALEGGPVAPAGACLVRLEGDGPPRRVPLDWHRVGYGWRPLWRCPTCGERVRILYGPTLAAAASSNDRAPLWTCRTCAALAYESTRLDAIASLERRAQNAGAALGVPNVRDARSITLLRLPAWPPRPPGMHWRTYRRHVDEWGAARRAYGAAMVARSMPFWRWVDRFAARIERRAAHRAR